LAYAIFLCGALLVAGFRLAYPAASIVEVVLVLVGLYLALKGRKTGVASDTSTRHTNANFDGDD